MFGAYAERMKQTLNVTLSDTAGELTAFFISAYPTNDQAVN
jgi:hypothetical protein